MKSINPRKIVTVIFIICLTGGYVRADKQQLMEKLSGNVKIEINDATITEALTKIGQAAEVKIVLSDEAIWKLPYGQATRLSVSLSGPLADSLTEMLNAFFMRYAVGDDEITIYPRQELEHILGRPGTEQLELLKRIYTGRIKVSVPNSTPEETIKLVNNIIEQVGPVSISPYYMTEDIGKILATTGSGTTVTLASLLEQAGRQQNLSCWYISRIDFPDQVPIITMVSKIYFSSVRLDQVIDVSFKDERADVILQRLAGWAGLETVVEKEDPSWLEEKISVDMQNITLRQAIRNIAGTVNGYVRFDDGNNIVNIQGPIRPRIQQRPVSTRPRGSTSADEGYVGKISIPMEGGKYFLEFMLRESDLTEELKKLRDEKIQAVMGKTEGN